MHPYFSVKENENKCSRISVPEIIITATDNTSQVKTYMEKEEVKKESAER